MEKTKKSSKSKTRVLNKKELKKQTDDIVNAVTSDKFLKELKGIWSAEDNMRLNEAATRFSKENLSKLGIDIPKYTRISTRYFEENQDYQVDFGETFEEGNLLSLLNNAKPGLLDEIRKSNPEEFKKLVKRQNELLQMESQGGLCVCVGAVICIGVGGDLAASMAERIELSHEMSA